MTVNVLAAEGETVGNPAANIGIFALFVAVTLFIVIRASKKNATAAEFFTAGRSFTGPQNGIAISGDYLSAASFLGIAGAIAVYGYDGFLYSIGFLVAWLVALLLVAELLRNAGKFTMADVLSFRLKQRPVRMAAATTTLAVCLFYLLAQMAGAGGLVALLLNVTSDIGQALVIAVVGLLMIVYVLIGGMKGTTWVQIIKAVLLIGGAALMTVMVLAKFGMNFSEILGSAQSAVSGSTTEARRQARRAGARRPVRRQPDVADQLHLAGAGACARHRGPAARADALLHGADRQGGPALGGVGDRPDRRVLPLHAGAGLRRGGTRRAGRNPRRPGCAELGGAAAGVRTRRRGSARHHLGGGVRDDPRGRRGADHHRGDVVRARHLRQRAEEPRGDRGRTGAGVPHHRGGDRHPLDRCSASSPPNRTSRSWWRWRSRSRPPPTCRRFCIRCTGNGSTPAARCGACTAG